MCGMICSFATDCGSEIRDSSGDSHGEYLNLVSLVEVYSSEVASRVDGTGCHLPVVDGCINPNAKLSPLHVSSQDLARLSSPLVAASHSVQCRLATPPLLPVDTFPAHYTLHPFVS